MNAKQLRDSILHYAMQGKLLDYFSEDDSIIRKRELLTKSIDPLNNEYDFDIPKNWGLFKLGEVLKVSSGKNITKKDMIETGEYPVYGGNGVNGRYHSFNVEENTIVIGRVGFYCGAIHITDCKSWVTDNALIVDYDKTLLSKEWLVMALEYAKLGKTASATAQPVISGRKIYPLVIPIPPLEDQLAITKKVKILEKKVEKFNSLLNEANVLKDNFPIFLEKSILQFAMQGKLVRQDSNDEPVQQLIEKIQLEKERLIKEKFIKKEKPLLPITEEEIPFDIPSSWEWVRLKEISTFGNFETVKPELISDEEWILDLEEIEKNTGKLIQVVFNSDKKVKSNKYKFKSGDVLYGKLRPYLNKVIIAPNEGYCTTEIFPITLLGNIAPKYLQMALMSPYFLSYANSCSYGVKMPRLGTNQLAEALIPLPPLNEQKRIINKVDELLTVSKQLINSIS